MPPALQPQPETITLEQYEALPEHVRAEVFDGQVYYMASPSQIHQSLLMELSSLIHSYVKKKNGACKVFPAPFDVKLSDHPLLIVQPDIMVVCDPNKLDGKRCNGAPDFIIEIVSPGNPADDDIRKLYHYKNYGVREYWIADPLRKSHGSDARDICPIRSCRLPFVIKCRHPSGTAAARTTSASTNSQSGSAEYV